MNKLIRTVAIGFVVAKAVDYLQDKRNRKKVEKFVRKTAKNLR